ncbi:putative membrane protein [Paenibacillus castaneae]|nr:putative membrane protein [Paenibacillus castaneae]
MFGWILVLHILASIAVIGPALVVPVIRRSARTVGQLRFAFDVTNKIALLPKIGGAVLIITGVWLMIITKMGLSQMWLNISILLSLLMVATIEGLIGPRMKKIMEIVSIIQSKGDEVPSELGRLMKKIVPIEMASQLLMIAIAVLMILKPF